MSSTAADQTTLFAIPPEDHLALIHKIRARRDALRKQIADLFGRRLKIAERMNLAEAEFEDMAEGVGGPRDAAERINALKVAKDKRDKARAEMRDAIDQTRGLKAALLKAQAELEASIGGIQRELIDQLVHVEPEKHTTAASLRSERQRRVADGCVVALRAMGGRASCVDLAVLVGVSPHGLGGLIDTDPRIRKFHDGRLNNLQTLYELTAEAGGKP